VAANDPGQPKLSPATGPADGWSTNLPVPGSALAIGAHPDDVEFGAGGTLAKWADAGCVVHHLVCTDGSKGTWDASADLPELVARRKDEQREAARRLAGARAGEVVFLGRVDGELDSDRATRGEVALVIRRLRPDAVLGHDPWKRYRLHPDHRNAGLVTCDAIVAARDPHFHPEHGFAPHRPRALLLFEADQPTHVEDVTATVERKLHALEAHRSQFESTMKAVDDEQLAAFRARVRDRLAGLGSPHDFAAAEVFALITDL
jgi:LmbE family N-acetylglucosaminyl deacetylase